MTDWNGETENLGVSNFWKPDAGQHSVKFLNDGEPSSYEDPKTGDKTPQTLFKIEVDGEEKDWSVTKAKTVNSLHGQIALMGKYHGNLTNKTITLLVKFDQSTNKRDYTIQEAMPLMKEYNELQKKKGAEKKIGAAPPTQPSESEPNQEAFGTGIHP